MKRSLSVSILLMACSSEPPCRVFHYRAGVSSSSCVVDFQSGSLSFELPIADPTECGQVVVYPCADAMTCTRTCETFELVAINRLDRDTTALIRCGVSQGTIQADFILESRGESSCD